MFNTSENYKHEKGDKEGMADRDQKKRKFFKNLCLL